jgi:hypothetical protein
MLNSGFVADQARRMAERMIAESQDDEPARVQSAYVTAYGRQATADEIKRGLAYIAEYASRWRGLHPDDTRDEAERRGWQSFCRAVLAANEFVYVE